MSDGGVLRAAVVVAHPDDETIWCGGTILLRPGCIWRVVSVCRADDADRAARFRWAMAALGADGELDDLDDGPEQSPLDQMDLQESIRSMLDGTRYDAILTHSLFGEYTRHRRHEEVARAVLSMWDAGVIDASELWMFAYEDGEGRYRPRPIDLADRMIHLPESIYEEKRRIIRDIYGFAPGSFEVESASDREAFWVFLVPEEVRRWERAKGVRV